jgi:hypothetical protein
MTDTRATSGLEGEIDFSLAGVLVRSIFDPAKAGHTTGDVVRHAGRSYALVRLKSGEIGQFPSEQLELVPETETRVDAVAKFQFAGPEQLHLAILTEKVWDRLTEVWGLFSPAAGSSEKSLGRYSF